MYRLPPRPGSNQGSKNFIKDLWSATEPLRGEAPVPEFREMVLGLALLKSVYSTFEAHREALDAMFRDSNSSQYMPTERERQVALNSAETFRSGNGFFVPLFAAWRRIEATATERPERLARLLEVAMGAVERENPELQGIFPASCSGKLSDETLAALVKTISELCEGLQGSDPTEMARLAREIAKAIANNGKGRSDEGEVRGREQVSAKAGEVIARFDEKLSRFNAVLTELRTQLKNSKS